jgi:hypothetical protein
MVVWGFTAGLLDAVLTAAGLTRPWDTTDVRPLAVPPPAAARLPGSAGGDRGDDAAAPEVADRPGGAAPTRTVPDR